MQQEAGNSQSPRFQQDARKLRRHYACVENDRDTAPFTQSPQRLTPMLIREQRGVYDKSVGAPSRDPLEPQSEVVESSPQHSCRFPVCPSPPSSSTSMARSSTRSS